MDQATLIQESFWALNVNMALKDYEEAGMIALYLSAFYEHFTDSQTDQMQITLLRLEHLQGQLDANKPD